MITVLVVDDAMTDRALVSGLLTRRLDCDVLEAADGRQAMDMIRQQPPDIVLTDLNMPEMDGLELVSEVKQNYPLIPVILMTAQGSEEIAAEALRAGAASYVPKRNCATDLAGTVNRVLDGTVEPRVDPHVMHYLTNGRMEFTLHNDPTAITSLVGWLQQMLRCIPLGDETERLRVGLAVEASLLNACFRGNLEIAGEDVNDRDELMNLARSRVGSMPYRERRIQIKTDITRDKAMFVVRDDGPGFDTSCIGDTEARLADPANRGRGLTLMQTIMDEVRFNDIGNEVTLIRYRYEPGDEDD